MEQGTFNLGDESLPAPVRLCGCGCGQPTPIATRSSKRHGHVKGQPTVFVRGHTTKAFNPRRRGGALPTLFVEVGQRIGKGVIIATDAQAPGSRSARPRRAARLRCDCGNEYVREIAQLLRVANSSCGCSGGRFIDRTGQRFGRLTAVRRAEQNMPRNSYDGVWWLCKCDCGNEALVTSKALGAGHTQSCGCLKNEPRLPGGQAALNKALNGYRQAAKQRGLSWALAKEDFYRLTAMDCFYCGAPPATRIKNGVHNGECVYNGLDRIDSLQGYFLENVLPCCPLCNHAKRDMPFDDFMAWIARLTEYHWFHPEVMPSALLRKAAAS